MCIHAGFLILYRLPIPYGYWRNHLAVKKCQDVSATPYFLTDPKLEISSFLKLIKLRDLAIFSKSNY